MNHLHDRARLVRGMWPRGCVLSWVRGCGRRQGREQTSRAQTVYLGSRGNPRRQVERVAIRRDRTVQGGHHARPHVVHWASRHGDRPCNCKPGQVMSRVRCRARCAGRHTQLTLPGGAVRFACRPGRIGAHACSTIKVNSACKLDVYYQNVCLVPRNVKRPPPRPLARPPARPRIPRPRGVPLGTPGRPRPPPRPAEYVKACGANAPSESVSECLFFRMPMRNARRLRGCSLPLRSHPQQSEHSRVKRVPEYTSS